MVLCSCGDCSHHGVRTATHHVRLRSPRPAPHRRMSSPRPRSQRFCVPVPLRLSIGGGPDTRYDAGAILQNVSQTGAFVRSALVPPAHSGAMLRFQCGGTVCVAAGYVVAVRPGRGFAVELEGANDAFDTLFAELSAVRESVSEHVLRRVAGAALRVA